MSLIRDASSIRCITVSRDSDVVSRAFDVVTLVARDFNIETRKS